MFLDAIAPTGNTAYRLQPIFTTFHVRMLAQTYTSALAGYIPTRPTQGVRPEPLDALPDSTDATQTTRKRSQLEFKSSARRAKTEARATSYPFPVRSGRD